MCAPRLLAVTCVALALLLFVPAGSAEPLTDVEVSRHHAVIEVFGRHMIYLRDLGSTNGTYHNGRRITVSKLQPGDTIGCGKSVMKLDVSR